MARVVLIGSEGFIGRHVRAALRDHQVLAITRSPSHEPEIVQLALGRASTPTLARALSQFAPDAVINCAGATVGPPSALRAANVDAVAALVDAVARAVPTARLVQLGSAAEYGPDAAGRPTNEEAVPRPTSHYGVTKLAATELVMTSTVDGIVLRLFNPVGAGMSEATLPGRAATMFRVALHAGTRRASFGSLSAARDFFDARDAADAIVAAAFVPSPVKRLINCGCGVPTTGRSLVERLARVAGFDGTIVEDVEGSPRSDQVPWQVADTSRAAQVLQWKARRTLDEALRCLWRASGSLSNRSA